MDERRPRFNLLVYTYMAMIVISYFTGINTTACTDQTDIDNFKHGLAAEEEKETFTKQLLVGVRIQPPRIWSSHTEGHVKRNLFLPMCSSGTLSNTRVVIDTWGTGGPDVHSCNCTVTMDTGSAPPTVTTPVTVQEYPGVAPYPSCGSRLRITSTTVSSFTETGCTPIPAYSVNYFGGSDNLILTLSRADISKQWRSGHCIFISQGVLGFDVIVTCAQRIRTTTPTTTKDIPTTTFKSRETTTTTLPRETTTTTQSRETTTYNITGSTTLGQENCVQQIHLQQGYPLSAVVVPLVVITLLITVSVVAHVILYRRRLALLKRHEYTEAVMTSPQPVNYDSLDLSRVEPPNIYADTSTGQMYVNTAMDS